MKPLDKHTAQLAYLLLVLTVSVVGGLYSLLSGAVDLAEVKASFATLVK